LIGCPLRKKQWFDAGLLGSDCGDRSSCTASGRVGRPLIGLGMVDAISWSKVFPFGFL
jgi:hypothetical protein